MALHCLLFSIIIRDGVASKTWHSVQCFLQFDLVPCLVPPGSRKRQFSEILKIQRASSKINLVPGLVPPGSRKQQLSEILEIQRASSKISLVPGLVPCGSRKQHLFQQHETPTQFRQRIQKVEDHMNSDAFAAPDGNGLLGLAKSLRSRCEAVVEAKGERLPK